MLEAYLPDLGDRYAVRQFCREHAEPRETVVALQGRATYWPNCAHS